MTRTFLILVVPAALAACSSEPSVNAVNASVSDVQNQVAAAGGVKMKPGRWETEVTMNLKMPNGLPSQGPQTSKAATCLTPEQTNARSNPFAGQLGAGCKYDKFTMDGGKIDATMSCDMQGMKMNGTVAGDYASDSFKMTSSMKTSGAAAGPMAGLQTETSVVAKRTGECRGDETTAPNASARSAG